MGTFKELFAWKKGIDLVKAVYIATSRFPSDERFGLSAQMRRAAVSIPSNIAEGNGRPSRSDYCHFLHIARGSCNELETQIIIAKELGFLDPEQCQSLTEQVSEVRRLLNGLIRRLSIPSEL